MPADSHMSFADALNRQLMAHSCRKRVRNAHASSNVNACGVQGLRVVGVDPNPEMAPYALQAAEEAGLSREQLQLMDGTAQQLPVPSRSQDAVICTLVSILLLNPLLLLLSFASLRPLHLLFLFLPANEMHFGEHFAACWLSVSSSSPVLLVFLHFSMATVSIWLCCLLLLFVFIILFDAFKAETTIGYAVKLIQICLPFEHKGTQAFFAASSSPPPLFQHLHASQ